MSNTSPDQSRNLQKIDTASTQYSASPSQLTLSSNLPSGASLGNPYQPYSYIPSPHDPSGFAFPPQPGYRTQLQAHHVQPQPQHFQAQSPTNVRKRRASELGEPSLPGSASSGSSAFNNPTGLGVGMGPPGLELDVSTGTMGGPAQTLPSPVVKKGRTNTPWTPAEEQRLKTLREAGSSWSEIAKTFPTRTEGSVKKHWYKDMHYAEFAEDEVSNFVRLTARDVGTDGRLTISQSAALLQAIKDYENNKWKVIGQKVGKPAKACEQFAKEQGWKV